MIEGINAITLAVHAMAPAVRFYRALGFTLEYGGEDADFSSFAIRGQHLNLILAPDAPLAWWGRVIFYVADVDDFYARVVTQGLTADFAPRDAEWGERYFHIHDPDGHELSFARPLHRPPA